ncbi:hypothetical protein [Hymenobacter cellulosilyticus]|uniref:Uncharacterized protein n=1 Tax=Hymenobacter cellulosilyticus TaxID=2932248 RepID=A0A8T9Q889_9BACT|nr:hypothetical protein [Hymenobacter cellulosilyticus]UOQ73162.1 hypothetical protein MUN79_04095 [Hymenobacter cellulosilyticus]
MMEKDFWEQILGEKYVVRDVVDAKENIYIFFVSKEYHESGGNDQFLLIGSGPLCYNKSTRTHKILGVVDYIENHSHIDEIQKYFKEEPVPSLDEIIRSVKARQHLNFDELEYVMNHLGIDYEFVEIRSNDLIHEYFNSSKSEYILLFRKFLDEAGLAYEVVNNNSLVFKNN